MDQRATVARHFSLETNKWINEFSRIARHLKTKWINELAFLAISHPKRTKWINELVELLAI